MSRHVTALLVLIALPGAAPAAAQPVAPVYLPEQTDRPDAATLVADAADSFRRRTRADCIARAATGDIVVCAPVQDQALPVPEIYGPVAGSTDGAAVDPGGIPCGASISNQCWGGINLLVVIPVGIGIVQLLIDPDRNLGEGEAIPERFRGANR